MYWIVRRDGRPESSLLASAPRRTSRYFEGKSLASARSVFNSRPTAYDPELADTIIDMIASGESLNEICEDRDAPLPGTFLRWCNEDAKLDERYRAALTLQADVLFEEATSAAFDPDSMKASIRHRALMARAERMMPDKYGPRSTVRSTKEVPDEAGGIDYAGDVRRRLEAMSSRMRTEDQTRDSSSG